MSSAGGTRGGTQSGGFLPVRRIRPIRSGRWRSAIATADSHQTKVAVRSGQVIPSSSHTGSLRQSSLIRNKTPLHAHS